MAQLHLTNKLQDALARLDELVVSGFDHMSPNQRGRVRVLHYAPILFVPVCLGFAIYYGFQGHFEAASAISLGMLGLVGAVAVLRRSKRAQLTAHLICGSLLGATVAQCISLDGAYETASDWIYVIPPLALLVLPYRPAWLWTFVSIGAIAGLSSTYGDTGLAVLVARSCLVLTLAGLMTSFIVAQRLREQGLAQNNDFLRDRTGGLGLMQEIAVAANRASSFEAAAENCMRMVSMFSGWRVAHMYVPSEDADADSPELVSSGVWHSSDAERFEALHSLTEAGGSEPDPELLGAALEEHELVWQMRLEGEPRSERDRAIRAAGLTTGVAIPIVLRDGNLAGVIELFHEEETRRDETTVQVFEHLATQLGYVWDRDRAAKRIRALAYYDGLTGLPNRQRFQQSLERALERGTRGERSIALLFLDLDGFKRINDTMGHAMGDRLLREVAERFTYSVRATDVVGRDAETDASQNSISRLGGDEFTVLVNDLEKPEDAGRVARRMLQSLRDPIELGDERVFVSASIGIAVHPQDGEDAITLLKHADTAMYEAKARGRGQFQYFAASMNTAGASRVRIEAAVRHSLANDGFQLHYQPVRGRDGAIHGVEALVRMEVSNGPPIGPQEFIPVAEECGLVIQIGEWVLDQACRQLREWRANRPGFALRMAVNVSAHQLRHPGFVPMVEAALNRYQLPPNVLELELTETAITTDDELTTRALNHLAQRGVGLALDDFGTGYSAISYLRLFPINRVKIDRSFVCEIPHNEDDCQLSSAIIAMAHGLRREVVAEGVETAEQAEFLLEQGCDELQGYWISRPVPPSEIEALLDKEEPVVRVETETLES